MFDIFENAMFCIIICMIFAFGCCVGVINASESYENEAVQRGHGYYNPTNRHFEWKTNYYRFGEIK